jgi:hypothetical protein
MRIILVSITFFTALFISGFFTGIQFIKKRNKTLESKSSSYADNWKIARLYQKCYEFNDIAACCELGADISQKAAFDCIGAEWRNKRYKKQLAEYLKG